MLSTISRRSVQNLATKSTAALNKSSVISIAKQSVKPQDIDKEEPWHAVPTAEEVVSELASSFTDGLSTAEAERRLKEFGKNQLTPPHKPSFLARLWAQLNSIIIFILFGAAIVEGALQSWAEFGLVLAVIVLNTAIGMIQEGKAEKAADAIKQMLSPTARVLRNGEQQMIPAEELVPGDMVMIKSGDKIPADMRLISTSNLQVQEAMLTGESVPVSKNLEPAAFDAPLGDRKCICYSATAVTSGQGLGIVIATGDSAEIGQINRMVNTVERAKNNLVHQLEILGRWLAVLVLLVALIAFLLALLRAKNGFEEAFESAVSIAVAIIPEGLPAMVTIVLAVGTTVMARNNAIIRQLPAVETLGSLNIICSDKTGTLTKNEMTVVKVRTASHLYNVSGVGYEPTGTFSIAAASDSVDGAASAKMTTTSNDNTRPVPPSTGHTSAGHVVIDMKQTDDANDGSSNTSPESAGAPLSVTQLAAVQVLLQGTVLCNDSTLSKSEDTDTGKVTYSPLGAPTEVALHTAAAKAGLDVKQLQGSKPRLMTVPFESEHKFMATVHEEGGKRIMYVKGAPDRLLPLCNRQVMQEDVNGPTATLDVAFWQHEQKVLSSQGLRVLALCRTELDASEDLDTLNPEAILARTPFLAMVMMLAILDPPREEAVRAVGEAHSAGITVKMITGDHALTALAIGQMLGLAAGTGAQTVLTGPELDAMNDGALRHVVRGCNVFARASPENKLRIVRALQEHNLVVAMTGDGVNDAPALKAADVGVAMGITGTDVSKEAAKMVLADDNFASIVAAVKEGRRVWDNIRKLLIFNLPVNLAQGMSIMYAYILGLENPPLTALQVLLVNLVTSVTLGLALAAEPPEPGVMQRPPRRAGKRLVGKRLLWRMFFVCHMIVILVIGMFYWAGQQGLSLGQSRAEAFNILVGSQVVYCITCRFLTLSTLHPRVFYGNTVIYFSISIVLALKVFITHVPGVNEFFNMEPMTGMQWGRVFVCMAVVYIIVEIEKGILTPLIMPHIRPIFKWMEDRTPGCLSLEWKGFNPCPRCTSATAVLDEGTERPSSNQRRGRLRKSKIRSSSFEKSNSDISTCLDLASSSNATAGAGDKQ